MHRHRSPPLSDRSVVQLNVLGHPPKVAMSEVERDVLNAAEGLLATKVYTKKRWTLHSTESSHRYWLITVTHGAWDRRAQR